MPLSRTLWQIANLVGRAAVQRVNKSDVLRAPRWPLTFARSSVGFHTSVWLRVEDSTSSSSSESESDSDTETSRRTPAVETEEEVNRLAVLRACLRLVREQGWSREMLAEGAKEAGFEGEEDEMFPNGPGDLVNLFEQQCNERLYQYMEKQKGPGFEGSIVIRPSVEQRLRMLAPYIEKWPQAMALKAYPPVAPTALENLSLMVDDIWYMAGDCSTDINWYTKRAILATIYTSTELYMIQDKSEDFEETWQFLDNRLQEAHDWGGVARGIMDFVCAGLKNVKDGWEREQTEEK